ncbi:MAG: hypothetical protein ABDI20_08830 [Candidatus Bipolaricaulaceae bacterium]
MIQKVLRVVWCDAEPRAVHVPPGTRVEALIRRFRLDPDEVTVWSDGRCSVLDLDDDLYDLHDGDTIRIEPAAFLGRPL